MTQNGESSCMWCTQTISNGQSLTVRFSHSIFKIMLMAIAGHYSITVVKGFICKGPWLILGLGLVLPVPV